MPTTIDRPDVGVDLEAIPTMDDEKVCHVLVGSWRGYTGNQTECGAPYDCVPAPACFEYNGQETCPDCGRPICPACERGFVADGRIGGIRRARGD